ncbi:cellulose binding domain-containing protein [Streptomyces radiopugnans]|nr:cellulose binding domain-containing protein [Streptomyces radiopugnans]
MSVRNSGTGTLDGWTVTMTLAPGQTLGSVWNGRSTGTGGTVTVSNTPWNGTLAVSGAVTFGFTATGSSTAAPGGIACTSP